MYKNIRRLNGGLLINWRRNMSLPVKLKEQTISKPSIHATLVINKSNDHSVITPKDMFWIMPATKEEIAELEEAKYTPSPDNPWAGLPAPPAKSFSSLDPKDVEEEQKFMKALEISLPPNDLFRIPVELSKPWFQYAIMLYCGLIAIASALFTDWDKLNEGHPHVFTGLQKWWGTISSYSIIDEETERQLIRDRLNSSK